MAMLVAGALAAVLFGTAPPVHVGLIAPDLPPGAATLTLPPAVIDDALEVTGDSVDAEQRQSRLFVDVHVNGQGPFRFLVDSGADRSVIGAALARRLALPADETVRLRSIGSSVDIATVRLDQLRIGKSEMADIVAPALPERFLGAQGLLGIDALGQQRLMLDFDARTITVQRADRADLRPADPDEIVVTARRRNGQLILTEVSAARQRLYAVIDSGTEVTLGNMALHARVFGRRNPPAPRPITLIGVTGEPVRADLVVLPELRVGKLTLRNVSVAFADVPPFALFGLADEPALLLGNDVLKTFRRVSLDFRNRKVRFTLRR